MKKEIDLSAAFKGLSALIGRYSLTLFIIVLVGGLSTAVLVLNSALQKTGDGTNDPLDSSTGQSFDQTTIERIKQLNQSSKAKNNYAAPDGRINPFTE